MGKNIRFIYRLSFCVCLMGTLGIALVGCPPLDDGDRDYLPGEGPRLASVTVTQEEIAGGEIAVLELRRMGRAVFSTPFNKLDGHGDGPDDPAESPDTMGGRPTLQGNGTFLRVNGLDAQTCLECHTILSNATVPAQFAIGGAGAGSSNAMFLPTVIDVADDSNSGLATFNGRFINPPFLFGSGGVELLGKEMTVALQALKAEAEANPGIDVELLTKGVYFGILRFSDEGFDYSDVEGIDTDLVVRPFGRKGEFATTRAFDQGAFIFHLGMEPVEVVGEGVDGDGDGVINEVTVGQISALEIFNTSLERPERRGITASARRGEEVFEAIGCAECHVPRLTTDSRILTYAFPEVAEDPSANIFYRYDLAAAPTSFQPTDGGGVSVPLFADLKRHDLGPGLSESFGSDLDSFFTTARLWGVADTAPYLHDGRALTLGAAIRAHGGEAEESRDAFVALSNEEKADLLRFLRTLRTPRNVGRDLDSIIP